MNILKKKTLWLTLYTILVSVLFLYLLFPSDLVQSRLEEAFHSTDFVLKTKSLKPSLPLGIKLKNAAVSSASSAQVLFQSDWLDIQIKPLSLFQKNTQIGISGKAYGGIFDGQFGLNSLAKIYPLKEGLLNFQNIDLARYTSIKTLLGKEITGKAKGSWKYQIGQGDRGPTGSLSVFLTKGTYTLIEPFLGLNRIDFDRGEVQGRFQGGNFLMEKFEMTGAQVKCSLKGEITPADDLKNSWLNLSGTMEIQGQNKAQMNVTIGGTLANPIFRYI